METELILNIGGLPPLSARGCKQELMPIQQGSFMRTINGELVLVGGGDLKYRSTIECEDKTTMATNGLYPGSELMVGCIQRLWEKVSNDAANEAVTLERYPVTGSVVVMDEDQKQVLVEKVDGKTVHLKDRAKTYYISYRPWLNMRAITYSLNTNEWDLKSGWTLELEEI